MKFTQQQRMLLDLAKFGLGMRPEQFLERIAAPRVCAEGLGGAG